MAVQNRLVKQEERKEQSVTYEVDGLQVTLTPQIVRDYLVSGDKERVTIQEVTMFINLCRFSKLNPWLKEAYCIKYGNEPATLVVGKSAFEKRAEDHPAYDGQEAGIILCSEKGEVIYRRGTLKLPGEELVGGYAEVWRKDRQHSSRIEVSFDEYVGRKKDGELNSQWKKKPATMIRKVALVQALREAFPKSLGELYTVEEQETEEQSHGDIMGQLSAMDSQEQQKQAEPTAEPDNNDVAAALFGS